MAIPQRNLSSTWEFVASALQIIDVDGSHIVNGASPNSGTAKRDRERSLKFAKPSNIAQFVVLDEKNIDELSLANARSMLGYRFKNGSNGARRIRDQVRTSLSAVFCSSASSRSRLSSAIVALASALEGLRRPLTFGALGRLSVAAFRRRVLIGLPPALERRRIASPMAQDKAS